MEKEPINKLKITLCCAMLTLALGQLAAQAQFQPGDRVIPPPAFGMYYSLSNPNWPPVPGLPCDCPVYYLGVWDGFDAYGYDTGQGGFTLNSVEPPSPGDGEGGDVTPSYGAHDYTCGLWLDLHANATNSNFVQLGLHNTIGGHTYFIESVTNIVSTNWVSETNITASGDTTHVAITKGVRSNLFLRAWELDLFTNLTFTALSYTNCYVLNPDSMIAVGLDHVTEVLNGALNNSAIAVFDKNSIGPPIAQTNTLDFFRVQQGETVYPTGPGLTDQRMLYDRQYQRWVACALDRVTGSNPPSYQVLLAVSKTANATNLITGWERYLIPVKRTNTGPDFPTLGMDANGIYLSVVQPGIGANFGNTVVAIKKPQIYSNTLISTTLELLTNNTLPATVIQPAVNFDNVASNGYAYFVGKAPHALGTNYPGGEVFYRRLQWSNTTAIWVDTNWVTVTNAPGVTYLDYFDLDGAKMGAPQLNGSAKVPLETDSVLTATVIRKGSLWTCQMIGLLGTNGTYEPVADPDRSGVQWLKLSVDPAGGFLTYGAHGRVYDRVNATNALWYYFPSLAVNCVGSMLMGFSGSSVSNHISAYYTWRSAGGSIPTAPELIQAGNIYFGYGRCGDYSATVVDPVDDLSFWTVQQYADPAGDDPVGDHYWRTVIAKRKRE